MQHGKKATVQHDATLGSPRSSPGAISRNTRSSEAFEATGVEYLRTLAIARIVLDNFDNLQASWVTQGGKVGQLSLAFGANDMGSVMIEENVVRAAGAAYCMDEIEIVRNIENAGFTAKRRNMHYEILGDPVFRERDVPRMLELAVARAEGDDSRPPEIGRYAARSATEKKLDARTMNNDKFIVQRSECAVFHARWVLPIAQPPIRDGWVAVERRQDRRRRRSGGSIRPDGPIDRSADESDRDPARSGQRAYPPRTVLDARPGAARADDAKWVERLMALRRTVGHEPAAPIHDAISGARAAGTSLVGDITNTLAAYAAARRERVVGGGLSRAARVQRQRSCRSSRAGAGAIRGVAPIARLRPSIVPHAPYSVSPALLREIAPGRPAGTPSRAFTSASPPRRSSFFRAAAVRGRRF